MPEKILITGGAGFVGYHVVQKSLAAGFEVSVLEYPTKNVDHLPLDEINIIRGDILNAKDCDHALMGQEIVIHCAANANLWHKNPRAFQLINAQGTKNVLEAAMKHQMKRFIHVSTDCTMMVPKSMVGQQKARIQEYLGPYCYSKYLAEEYVQQAVVKGLNASIVNPAVPLGGYDLNQGPFTRTIEAFKAGKIKGFMEGHIWLIDVEDVANGIMTAIDQAEVGHSYILAHERWSIQQLFQVLGELMQKKAPKLKVPYAVAYSAALLEEKLCALNQQIPLATTTGLKLARCDIPPEYFQPQLPIEYHCCKTALKRMLN